jgi:glycosyltransferase involved in cell wall biosynthesis
VLLAVPFLIMGGAERILHEAVGQLARSGHRVVIVSTLAFGPEFGDSSAAFESITPEIYHLPRFLTPDRWQHFVDYLIEAKHVDVLWIVNSAFFHSALPYLKGRHPHLRVADQQFNTVAHSANNRNFAAHIDLTITENSEVGAWLAQHGETPERIAIIPSGVDLQSFSPSVSGQTARAALGFPSGTFVVGFSGRLAEEKAPLSVLRIAASISAELPIRFVMTGTGPLEGQVRHEIERLKLENRVSFQGLVADVRDYLACYDVLVLPSVIDGRPVVVMEALAMGLPVIASRVGGLSELIVEGKTGFLCDPHDIAGFALRITQLQTHPETQAEMRKAARDFAEEHLDVESMRIRYEETLMRVADRAAVQNGTAKNLMDVA